MIGHTSSHYRIIEKLGEGGMGVVYKAQDTTLDRLVALKFLPAHIAKSDQEKSRFMQEAKAASALNHPNVCTIYGIDEIDGRQFIAMELVDGTTLRDKVSLAHGAIASSLTIKQVVDYGIQIAEALQEAHSKGIVHRDIKSENIMVNSKNQIKVMDFGLAKLKGSLNLTRTSSTIGTLAYMSPEQIQGTEADARSDIFSFGVVLFEMATGKMPFRGEHDAAIMYSIVNEEPDDASKYREDVSSELLHILNKSLEKDPEDRFQSMAEVIIDLRRLKKESTRVVRMQNTPPINLEAHPKIAVPAQKFGSGMFTNKTLAAIGAVVAAIAVFFLFKESLFSLFGARNEKKIIAVLPFENLGPAEKDYFVDGMTDEISSRLAGLSGLRVIARSSAGQYKKTAKTVQQIGAELGVTYILQGSVRWETVGRETHVRVNPTLTRVDDGTLAWSESMESVLSSAFKLQSDIAARVASAMDLALATTEKKSLETSLTDNSEAYDYYLRGIEYSTRSESRSDYEISIQFLERAIRVDPSFAAAYAKLGFMHCSMYWFYYDRSEERIGKARRAAEKALALAPTLSESHDAMGWYYYQTQLDYARALDEFALALKYRPNNSTINYGIAAVMRRQGNAVGAEESFKKALVGNPRSADLIRQVGETQNLLRKYEEADANYAKALELAPDITVIYVQRLTNRLAWNGDVHEARSIVADAMRLGKVDDDGIYGTSLNYLVALRDAKYGDAERALRASHNGMALDNQFKYTPAFELLGALERLQGNEARAKKYYDSARVHLERKLKTSPDDERLYSELGVTYAGLGLKEEAIRYGMKGVEMLPIEKEAWRGSFRLIDLAQIYAQTGELEKSIDLLQRLLSIPAEISRTTLKNEPRWNPLRANKRFQQLTAG
jgi:eukaryotic-like serine/threonine-protein kinase